MNRLYEGLKGSAAGKTLILLVRVSLDSIMAVIGFVLVVPAAVLCRITTLADKLDKPRLVWGTVPLKSITYTSQALRQAGYRSDTVVLELYHTVKRADFNFALCRDAGSNILWLHVGERLEHIAFFIKALFAYDIFHYFFDGGILRKTLLNRLELYLLKLAGKKIILFPYGSDSFVYEEIRNPAWRQSLMINYPQDASQSARVKRNIRRGSRLADVIVGTIVHIENLPRWDILPVVWYPVDTDAIRVRYPNESGTIRICHAPNHRGAKGTEFLVTAVGKLMAEGHDIELDLVEGVSNQEAMSRIADADILVDQLIFGYALTAMEGMAMGKVVISGLGDQEAYRVFRQNSYLDECPIVPANTENIEQVLSGLIRDRGSWREIGEKSRAYTQKYHSFEAARNMWQSIYDRVWLHRECDLSRFFSPSPQDGQVE